MRVGFVRKLPRWTSTLGSVERGPQVGALANRRLGVLRSLFDQSREVANSLDLEVGEQVFAQLLEIQPLVRLTFEAAVIQVEAVYIHVEAHRTNATDLPQVFQEPCG
jgi:hypothetical protein